jgi:hypothetical protein
MLKKILLIMGVATFGVFWWLGFEKVREMSKTQTLPGGGPEEFMGKL